MSYLYWYKLYSSIWVTWFSMCWWLTVSVSCTTHWCKIASQSMLIIKGNGVGCRLHRLHTKSMMVRIMSWLKSPTVAGGVAVQIIKWATDRVILMAMATHWCFFAEITDKLDQHEIWYCPVETRHHDEEGRDFVRMFFLYWTVLRNVSKICASMYLKTYQFYRHFIGCRCPHKRPSLVARACGMQCFYLCFSGFNVLTV